MKRNEDIKALVVEAFKIAIEEQLTRSEVNQAKLQKKADRLAKRGGKVKGVTVSPDAMNHLTTRKPGQGSTPMQGADVVRQLKLAGKKHNKGQVATDVEHGRKTGTALVRKRSEIPDKDVVSTSQVMKQDAGKDVPVTNVQTNKPESEYGTTKGFSAAGPKDPRFMKDVPKQGRARKKALTGKTLYTAAPGESAPRVGDWEKSGHVTISPKREQFKNAVLNYLEEESAMDRPDDDDYDHELNSRRDSLATHLKGIRKGKTRPKQKLLRPRDDKRGDSDDWEDHNRPDRKGPGGDDSSYDWAKQRTHAQFTGDKKADMMSSRGIEADNYRDEAEKEIRGREKQAVRSARRPRTPAPKGFKEQIKNAVLNYLEEQSQVGQRAQFDRKAKLMANRGFSDPNAGATVAAQAKARTNQRTATKRFGGGAFAGAGNKSGAQAASNRQMRQTSNRFQTSPRPV